MLGLLRQESSATVNRGSTSGFKFITFTPKSRTGTGSKSSDLRTLGGLILPSKGDQHAGDDQHRTRDGGPRDFFSEDHYSEHDRHNKT